MNFRRPLFAVICALLVSSAYAQISPKDKWLKITTPNFTLVGNANEKELRGVATKLEQFRTTFKAIFPNAKFVSAIPTNVIVFKSSSSFNPYKPKRADGKPDEWLAGYFRPGEDVNYITLSTEGEPLDTYGTIFHEYVHSLLNTTFGKSSIPPWFNEGLAEYYQTFEIEEDQKVKLGQLQNGHLMLLQQSKLIPLKQFFAIDNRSLHQNGNHSRSIFYAQAWALMHYLIQGNGGTNVEPLGKFLLQVMNDVEPEKAFQAAFGSDYATMERSLKKYVDQRTYQISVLTFKQKLVFDDKFTVLPLTEAQANAYLGDLLYHGNELSTAEAHLQRSLELEPGLSMAQTSLGLVKMRQRDFPSAKKHLEAAISDDQKNHFAHYSYAYVLSRESMDQFGFVREYPPDVTKKMIDSLKRSIELNPEFSESYRMLAFVLMIGGDNLNEAIALLRRGMAYQPGNQQYELLLAQIYLRQQKFDEAKTIVDRLARTTDDESMRATAAQIASTIAEYQEAKKNSELSLTAAGLTGSRRPVLIRRESMTDEQYAKLERDREIRNLNSVIERAADGEKRAVGQIEKIACVKGEVIYDAIVDGSKLPLVSKDFQSLRLEILREGTNDVSVGCDRDIAKELAVITYRTEGTRNVLTSLHFVPNDFRLMSAQELANAPNIIVQGGPASDTTKNAAIAAEEMAELEKKREQIMMQRLEDSLRRPQDGEVRMLGSVDGIECSSKEVAFNVRGTSGVLKLKAPPPNELKIISFTQDASGISFGCGVSYPTLTAVITYRPSQEKKGKTAGDLVALEFVPKAYQLPAEN